MWGCSLCPDALCCKTTACWEGENVGLLLPAVHDVHQGLLSKCTSSDWLKNNISLRAAVSSVHGPWLLEHQTKG